MIAGLTWRAKTARVLFVSFSRISFGRVSRRISQRRNIHRLPVGKGLLAFVVPGARLPSLAVELIARAAQAGFGVVEFRNAGRSRIAAVSGERTIAVTTWDTILTTVASALEAAQDHMALADIRQLQGLAEKMDSEGFLPLTATDITGPTPRRVMQFCNIVDEAWSVIARLPYVSSRGLRVSAGAGWYGPYMRLHGYGCQLIFSAPRWSRFGRSPIWFRISTRDSKTPDGLYSPVSKALPDPTWLQEEQRGLWMPIRLVEGREKDVVVAAVVSQVQQIADALAPHAVLRSSSGIPEAEEV